jgi:hypothetical protein
MILGDSIGAVLTATVRATATNGRRQRSGDSAKRSHIAQQLGDMSGLISGRSRISAVTAAKPVDNACPEQTTLECRPAQHTDRNG